MDKSPENTPLGRALRYRAEHALVALLAVVVRMLPMGGVRTLAKLTGRVAWAVWASRRALARRNLQRSYPGMDATEIDRVVAQTFESTATALFEVLRFPRMTHEDVLRQVCFDGPPRLQDVAAGGRGAILISGHFGNWELLGAWVRAQGFPVDLVVKPMRNPHVDALFNRCRASMGVGIIHTQVATREIVRALKENRLVAILADQYAGAEGVDVDFFGRPASTPRGPAALALKFGCPVILGTLERLPGGGYRASIEEPTEPRSTGDPDADVRSLMQTLTLQLESHIRRAPGQWLWTHNRWHD